MPIRANIILLLLLTSTLVTFAQNEASCMQELKRQYKASPLAEYKGSVDTSGKYFKYNNGVILVENTSTEILQIFSNGLISPGLFGAASSSDTIRISNVEKIQSQQKKKMQFSFLLYRNGIMNPSLFLFELKNSSSNTRSFINFLNKVKLSAFGFCSILI